MAREMIEILARVRLGGIERAVAEALARADGRWLATPRLVSAAYDGHPSGGPEDAEAAVKATVQALRRKLGPHGLAIEGVSYCGRRMVVRDAAQ